ncbi:MAG: PQQ-binding-like beta-propeller repeat protein [Candidatus Bathyarchaeia archaeon]
MKRSRKILLPTLVLAAVMLLSGFGVVGAHTPPWRIPTYAYLEVFPSPIGKGQSLYVFGFMDKYPPTASGKYGDRWTMELIITKPDNTQEIKTYTSDPVGCIFDRYTPTQTGTYKFQLHFPEQVLEGKNPPPPPGYAPGFQLNLLFINDTFLESYSAIVSVTVQEEPIPEYAPPPLPKSYWTRPISQENLGWGQLTGNWLGLGWVKYPYGTRVNPYSKGPESAHIVWTRPITFGGIVEGQFDDLGYYTGISYESYWTPPVVMLGRLYYNTPAPPRYGWYCVDLRTGEEIWWHNSTGPILYEIWFFKEFYPQLRFGQLLDYESPNQHGILAYLWATYSTIPTVPAAYGNVWQMYDAFTGNWICNIINVPSGTTVLGKDGSILIYQLNAAKGWLALWNSSRAIWEAQKDLGTPGVWDINEYWMWRPRLGGTIDGSKGYSWNVTLPEGITGSIVAVLEDRILGTSGLAALGQFGTPPYTMWCLDTRPGHEGEKLWLKSYSPPPGNLTLSVGPVSLQDGVFTMRSKETRQWWGYSLENGSLLWGPTESETDLHMYGVSAAIAYGRLYSADSVGGGGTVYCYDVKTGQRLWTYETENLGLGGYWPRCTAILGHIADKKLYLYTNEHSPGPTLWAGAKLRCIDADNGTELWKISFWGNGPIVADGYLVDLNAYDNRIYCFGKGQTAIELSALPKVVSKGSSVLIEGRVLDLSPAAKGTPAVADEDMSGWMEYLVMQKSMPGTVRGVPVEVYAISETGETTMIGTATTDPLNGGIFRLLWTPPNEGTYIITAVFAGSKSYWDSYASTAIGVTSVAPTAAATVEALQPWNIVLTVLVAIAIVIGAANLYLLRKRK